MREYELIKEYYGSKVAKRSGLPLMNHIDEGLQILERYPDTGENTLKAFCIHPIIQDATDPLHKSLELSDTVDPSILQLAMEYAITANQYLPKHCKSQNDVMPKITNHQVQLMLIADKVQNYKDFYRTFRHNQAACDYQRLSLYFANWLYYLCVNPVEYNSLIKNLPQ